MVRWNALPFVRNVIALMTGIVGYLLLPIPITVVFALLVVVAGAFVASFFFKSSPNPAWKGSLGLSLFSLIGWLSMYSHTASNQPDNLLHINRPIRAYEAVVGTPVENRAKTFRLELDVRKVRTDSAWQPATGRLIVYIDKTVAQKPHYGDVWLVQGEPRTIDPPLNPGEFNYQRFLAHRGIYHQQYLRPTDRQVIGYKPANWLKSQAYSINEWADSLFTSHLGSGPEFAIVKAMILGIRDGIDPDLQQAYSAAGAVHILSVSGLHVGVLFTAVSFLLAFLKRRRGGKFVFAAVMLSLLWFYALMTGFSAPVLRSAFMFSLILLGQTMGRTNNPLNTLAASAFLILLWDPYALTTAGFQLSYLAVGGLISWYRPLYQSLTFKTWLGDQLWKLTAMALLAQLVTFPLAVFYFHQFPTYFWLANPVVVPLSSLVLVMAMGLLVVGWIPFVGFCVGKLLFGAMWLLNQSILWTEQLPYSVLKPLTLSKWELALIYFLILSAITLMTSRKRRFLWLAAACGFLLSASVGWTTLNRKHQRLLLVHFVPHQTAISFVTGKAAIFVSRKPLSDQSREIRFYVRNTWDSLGVSQVVYSQPADAGPPIPHFQNRNFTLYSWQGKRILMVNRLPAKKFGRFPFVVDYAIFSRNAIQSWPEVKNRVVARHLIFDDSNKTPLTDRLLQEARELGIQCHSVRQQGAYLVQF